MLTTRIGNASRSDGRHEAHEAREHDAVDVVADEHLDDRGVEGLAVAVAPVVDDDRRDLRRPSRARAPPADATFEMTTPTFASRRLSAIASRIGLEVRPAAGDEDAEPSGFTLRGGELDRVLASGELIDRRYTVFERGVAGHGDDAPSSIGASPCRAQRRRVASSSRSGTTKTKPTPQLNVRRISASSTGPRFSMSSKIGGPRRCSRARSRRGRRARTRGRLPGRPPPVMWLIAWTSSPAASTAARPRVEARRRRAAPRRPSCRRARSGVRRRASCVESTWRASE